MIQVALCDDDVNVIDAISDYLREKSSNLENEKLSISVYRSGEDFLNDIEIGATFHIVLMDIQMDGINGVDVGKILRNRPDGDDIIMIYISSHNNFYKEIAEVGSFRFLPKPISEQKLDEIFSRALNQAIKHKAAMSVTALFRYKIGVESCYINLDKIVYMKQVARHTGLFAWSDDGETIVCINKFSARFEDVVEQLPSDQFVHCERSYIVNLDHVCQMDKDSFILADKFSTQIPISKRFRSQVKDAYFKYMESMT